MSSTTSAVASASSTAVTHTLTASKNLKVVGIVLAITSGLLIGSSFVFKKKGLLRSQAGGQLGEGVAYLKSPLWWLGMSMMILGELCNFAAYAFVEAIVVTPLGALSVVICAILSSIFLNEKLSFFGWLGCGLCILGSVIIALNGPQEQTVGQITEFQKLFLAPGFLAYISVLITAALVIVFYFAPKYGKKSMLWYIFVCSMIGGISVSVTTGLGAAIVQTALGDNQFKHWFMYFLFGFVAITLLVEVYYLNVALALFNTAMVTPTYYVVFTFFSMVTTIVLFKGLDAAVSQILTLVMGFLVICFGITILQMSKVDPEKLGKLDRRSTMLLQAARAQTENMDEKGLAGYEDPGMDTLRGSFGAVGSIIRARTAKRMSQSSHNTSHLRPRPPGAAAPYDATMSWMSTPGLPGASDGLSGLQRHQLYDAPVPRDDASSFRAPSVHSEQLVNKRPTIKFDSQELVHQYSRPGQPQSPATHEHRQAVHGSMLLHSGYPPLPPLPEPRSSVASDGNLIGIEPPPPISGLPPPSGAGALTPVAASTPQVATIPLAISKEHVVHSAPPAMYQRVGPAAPTRMDSREVFDRTTLLSFPSVTDSSPSEWNDEELDRMQLYAKGGLGSVASSTASLTAPPAKTTTKAEQREKSKEREKTRTPKRYPKGLGEDDEEESERLWRKGTGSVESDTDLPPDSMGSIRLVPPSSSGHGHF
ncbi:magnesium transporter NIPA-domain-containing protein [Pholiota molesta]|nr:magnesium transporter NIPA-domain-containing protein [Pholiota molesta]